MLFTLALVALGAIGGAITALLSIGLVWLGFTNVTVGPWMLEILSAIGATIGAVLMPIFGWLLRGRYHPVRAATEITIGASLMANLAAITLRNLDSDVLIVGAFVGALFAFLRMRFLGKRTDRT
jgi:hypothetical protein